VTWTHPLVLAVPLEVLALLVAIVLLRREAPPAQPHPEMHPRNAWRQYYARYALLVIAFVVFDMEMAFMYPWAVAFRRMGAVAFGDMLVFVAILGVALAYMWRTGVLEIETPPR
jgi:NADH:ubiquinone oxidoreductase subunit 3 (subunit A)